MQSVLEPGKCEPAAASPLIMPERPMTAFFILHSSAKAVALLAPIVDEEMLHSDPALVIDFALPTAAIVDNAIPDLHSGFKALPSA